MGGRANTHPELTIIYTRGFVSVSGYAIAIAVVKSRERYRLGYAYNGTFQIEACRRMFNSEFEFDTCTRLTRASCVAHGVASHWRLYYSARVSGNDAVTLPMRVAVLPLQTHNQAHNRLSHCLTLPIILVNACVPLSLLSLSSSLNYTVGVAGSFPWRSVPFVLSYSWPTVPEPA